MKLALIGVGLIGGSAAAAFRAAGLVTNAVGFDLDSEAAARGVAVGVIDRASPTLAEALTDAELILLAVPVGAMPAVLAEIARHAPPFAVITDVGSTKVSVLESARAALSANSSFSFRRFVPAHPIAGGELPGVEHADATLFRGKRLITTPVPDTHDDALSRVESLWRAVGAEVIRMDAAEHDEIFAAVSHLPHLLSFALVAQIAGEADGDRKLGFAGAGFRDFTRIAAASPVMWRDIALANRTALSAELRGYRAMLDDLQRAVDDADAAHLMQVFDLASRTKRGGRVKAGDSE